MHWVFEVPVCPKCGCKSILVHPQRYTENDNWVTKDQLDADQTIKVAKTQPAIYISDESHLTCSECNFLFENEDLENILNTQDWILSRS